MQFWLATPPVRAILISANALDPVVRSRGHRAPGELFGGDGRPSGSHLRATIRPLSDDVIPRNACRWCVQVSKWTGWTTEKRANNLYSAALLTMSRIYMGFYPRKIIRFFLLMFGTLQLSGTVSSANAPYCCLASKTKS